jgi:hypothetical protein
VRWGAGRYREISASLVDIRVDVVPVEARFATQTVGGRVTRFTVTSVRHASH